MAGGLVEGIDDDDGDDDDDGRGRGQSREDNGESWCFGGSDAPGFTLKKAARGKKKTELKVCFFLHLCQRKRCAYGNAANSTISNRFDGGEITSCRSPFGCTSHLHISILMPPGRRSER